MEQLQVWRMSSGNVVVNHGGTIEILTPPTGVSFDIVNHRWCAYTLDSNNQWTKEYASFAQYGSYRIALEKACEMRDRALSFLLTKRLLPRIRLGYTPIQVGNLFAVYDPLEKRRYYFDTAAAAESFNEQATHEWVQEYLYDPMNMVEIRKMLKMKFTKEGVPCI